jgi:hypothetical protein
LIEALRAGRYAGVPESRGYQHCRREQTITIVALMTLTVPRGRPCTLHSFSTDFRTE